MPTCVKVCLQRFIKTGSAFISCVAFVALRKKQADCDAMKKQSESLSKEYDRLAEEHTKLEVLKAILMNALFLGPILNFSTTISVCFFFQKKLAEGDGSKKDD